MQKSLTTYSQTKSNSILKHDTLWYGTDFRDARMVQYPQINQCNTTHPQTEEWNSYDHTNRWRTLHHILYIHICIIYIYINYLSIIKSIHDKTTAYIIFNSETLNEFPLRSGRRKGHLLTTFIQHSFGIQQQ